jgi:zinc/manganese transport system ATP-binding protein
MDGEAGAVTARGLTLRVGGRTLFEDLSMEVAPSELVAILGPNGAGKTSLLRVLLGLLSPSAGTVWIAGHPPRRGRSDVGYVPQRRTFEPGMPLRGRDLVRLGLDGHRWGPGWPGRSPWRRVDEAIRDVEAEPFADGSLGALSGGEQQRLRVAQALVSEPRVLLCDEPLTSLDIGSQRTVTELLDRFRRRTATTVLVVTHDLNVVLPFVDRVLYLVGGRWAMGRPEEIITSTVLSSLYGTSVDVVRVRGRLIVVGPPDEPHPHGEPGPGPDEAG